VTAPLAGALSAPGPEHQIKLYVCGPTPMMRAVARLAADHRRPCDVSLEQVMGCGMGGCYSCVVLTRDAGCAPHFVRSCIDGPVFDSTRVVWEALTH
jgi:dihydroorotate dehydrogenase electron transfer subunit